MSTKRKRRRHVEEGASILPPGKSARVEGACIHENVLSKSSVKFSKQCLKDMIISQDVHKEIRFVRKDGVETMSACLQAFLQDLVVCIWREAQSRQRKSGADEQQSKDKANDAGQKATNNGKTRVKLTVQHFESVLKKNPFFAFLNDILHDAQAEDKVIIVDDEKKDTRRNRSPKRPGVKLNRESLLAIAREAGEADRIVLNEEVGTFEGEFDDWDALS